MSGAYRGPLHGDHHGWLWRVAHDGGGHSLELMQPSLSNNHGQNWHTSVAGRGTPGRANSSKLANLSPMILDAVHSPAVPRSTDPVMVTARVIDESPAGISTQLFYRLDGEALVDDLLQQIRQVALFEEGRGLPGPPGVP